MKAHYGRYCNESCGADCEVQGAPCGPECGSSCREWALAHGVMLTREDVQRAFGLLEQIGRESGPERLRRAIAEVRGDRPVRGCRFRFDGYSGGS